MRWIYILSCEGGYYYVGETKRLYRRIWEHEGGVGGLNTSIYKPKGIVAIYKVNTICKFMEYNIYINQIIDGIWHENYKGYKLKFFNKECEDEDNKYAENNIAECLMIHNKEEWNKIRGGKYTRFDIDYKYPENEEIKDLPLCKCNLPCDIKKNEENNYLYFRCAKKNIWSTLREEFNIYDEPCNFYKEYIKDKQLKLEENKNFEERSKNLKELYKKSKWLDNVEINDINKPKECIGGCKRTSESIKLSYNNEKRNLCFDCFIRKNDEISKKYNILKCDECLINYKNIKTGSYF